MIQFIDLSPHERAALRAGKMDTLVRVDYTDGRAKVCPYGKRGTVLRCRQEPDLELEITRAAKKRMGNLKPSTWTRAGYGSYTLFHAEQVQLADRQVWYIAFRLVTEKEEAQNEKTKSK